MSSLLFWIWLLGTTIWVIWSVREEIPWEGMLLTIFWTSVAILSLVSCITNANAQEVCKRRCILPPVEYDKPYTGQLTLETVPNQEELAKFCGKAYIPGLTLGCSQRRADSCKIVLVPDKIIEMNGWTRALMLRHELGHCNGWPGDHPGARGVADPAHEKLINPVLRW